MLISFIIPSYNSAQTVSRCLYSIFALPLKHCEFEVIFIDDCSTDNTCDIVAEYQTLHSNIILLKQIKNTRQGAARNRGLRIAKGEYICFVDSDDVVSFGIIDAIKLAKEKHLEMTAFHFVNVDENGIVISEHEHIRFMGEGIFSGIEMQNEYPYWCSGPVAYIYSLEFLKKVNYPFAEDVLYEDSDFVAVHLYYAKRMSYSKECGYIVYNRIGSTTRSITYKGVSDYLLLGSRMLQFYKHIIATCDESENKFANVILEGACYNVFVATKRLIKLSSINEVFLFYERIDSQIDRVSLSSDTLIHKFYWSKWTSLVMKHKYFTIIEVTIAQPLYKLYTFLRSVFGKVIY